MITEFAKAVCLPEEIILGKCRKYADWRHVYWMLMKREGFTVSEIGRLCGCNHGTVIHGIKRAGELIELGDRKMLDIYSKTKHIKRK